MKSDRRCLLLPAEDVNAPWLEAIERACTAAGTPLVRIDDDVAPTAIEPGTVLVTSSPAMAQRFAPTCLTVLLGSLAPGVAASDLIRRDALRLALAADMEPRDLKIVGDGWPNRELFPGVPVTAPDSGPPLPSREAVLGIYADGRPEVGAAAIWPLEVFLHDQRNPQATPGDSDITGMPRYLAFGPYLALPRGVWRARVTFEVDEFASRRRMRIEWGGREDDAGLPFRPGRPGRFVVTLEHSWTGTAEAELRVVLAEAAMDGRFTLESVALERVA